MQLFPLSTFLGHSVTFRFPLAVRFPLFHLPSLHHLLSSSTNFPQSIIPPHLLCLTIPSYSPPCPSHCSISFIIPSNLHYFPYISHQHIHHFIFCQRRSLLIPALASNPQNRRLFTPSFLPSHLLYYNMVCTCQSKDIRLGSSKREEENGRGDVGR